MQLIKEFHLIAFLLHHHPKAKQLAALRAMIILLLDEKPVVDRHRCHMAAKFGVFVDENHDKLPIWSIKHSSEVIQKFSSI